ASDIVYNIMDVCDDEKVPHPKIVSESGRAIVAHHSVLVVQAFGSIEKNPLAPVPRRRADHETHRLRRGQTPPADHKLIREIIEISERAGDESLNESWHDLIQIKEQAQNLFEVGLLGLEAKARIEELFWQVAEKLQTIVRDIDPEEVPEDLKNLQTELADQHICKFSVFQSLLDHWALGQLFPIVPIHRLNERPQLESTLVDITCDSDGKVSKFIDLSDVRD